MPPVTPAQLREAIAGTLALHVKSYDLAAACVHLGLAPQQPGRTRSPANACTSAPACRTRTFPELTTRSYPRVKGPDGRWHNLGLPSPDA